MWVNEVWNDKNHKPEKEYGNFEEREAKKGCWNCEGSEIEKRLVNLRSQ